MVKKAIFVYGFDGKTLTPRDRSRSTAARRDSGRRID